jgi:hypothetical protein
MLRSQHRAAFTLSRESKVERPNLLMLKSSFLIFRPVAPVRALLWFSFLVSFLVAIGSPLRAVGQQDFTMMVSNPNPAAVDAGQDSTSYITLGVVNGFTGTVSLSCAVTPVVANGPVCTPPPTATPPQQVAMSITVASTVPAGFYTLTVTGTGPAPSTTKTVAVQLTVLPVTPSYTIAVTTAIFPTSVHAGFTATAVVSVSPVNGYSGIVTPSCSGITPLATPAPFCSFSPATVAVNGLEGSSTLTITTTGPTTPPPTGASLPGGLGGLNGSLLTRSSLDAPLGNGSLVNGSLVNGLWLTFPSLGLIAAGLAASGRRRRRLWGLSLPCWIAASLLFLPACSSSPNTNTGLNGSTPKNTYVFTLTGTDAGGVAPSNEATPPTVSLSVN